MYPYEEKKVNDCAYSKLDYMFYREISDSYSMVLIGLELEINENTSVFWLIHFVL